MAEPTDNQMSAEAADILSLHRGIVSRWAGGSIADQAAKTQTLGTRSTGLLDHLAGQTSIGGGFGADAFEIAMFMASEAPLSAQLGLELRTMAVGDLADLVQVVLEEEEAALEVEMAALRTGRGRRPTAKPAAPTKAAPARRPAPAQARKIAAVRRALEAVRARAAAIRNAQAADAAAAERSAGASRTDRPGRVGSVDPVVATPSQGQDLGAAVDFVAGLPGLREAGGLLRAAAPRSRALDPQLTVASIAEITHGSAPSRALRMAEGDAEMAMLEPAIEPVYDAPTAAADGRPAARRAGGAFDATHERWVAPAAVPVGHRVTALRASRVQSARAAVATSSRPLAPLQAAQARGTTAAAPRQALAPQPHTTLTAQSATAGRELIEAPTAAMPALQHAVAAATQILQRAARAVAMLPAFRQTAAAATTGLHAVAPRAGRTSDGLNPADAAASLAPLTSARPTLAADRAAGVLDSGPTAAIGTRWADWLDAGDALLAAGPSAAAREAVRVGYGHLDAGNGDWLDLGAEDAAIGDADADVRAPAWSRGTASDRAITPRWLTPSHPQRVSSAASTPSPTATAATAPGAPAAVARVFSSPSARGTDAVRAPASLPTAGVALRAWQSTTALSERLLSGLEQVARPPAFASAATFADRSGADFAFGASSLADADAFDRRFDAFVTPSLAERPVAGALARDAGAGDWLQPGLDDVEPALDAGAADAPRVTALRTARARDAGTRARTATAPAAGQGATTPPSGRASAIAPRSAPMTSAANAAVATIVSRVERSLARGGGATLPAGDVMSFALGQPGVLGILQDGRADALTPMLAERAAEQLSRTPGARRWLRGLEDGSGELLDLGADVPEASAIPAGERAATPVAGRAQIQQRTAAALPGSPAAAATSPAPRATAIAAAKARIQAAFVRAGAGTASQRLADELLGGQEPAGLRAALALFGEANAGSEDLGARFVARWMGASEPRPSRAAQQAAERVALLPGIEHDGIARAARPTALTSAAAEATTAPDGEKTLVFEGLAGLAALRTMLGAGEVDSELLALGKVEPAAPAETQAAVAAPAPSSATASLAQARRQTEARTRAATAVRMHRFEPVGLGRGRQLFGRKHQSLRTVARGTRFGYGAAGLGAGGLVGLSPGEAEAAFFGDTYSASSTVARAERLSSAVAARRASRSGAVGHVMPAGGSDRTMVTPQGDDAPMRGPAVRPIFGDAPRDLISPSAIAAEVASSAQLGGGATAAAKGGQAASLARVLSVTASPGGNVLPLVAPAARAVVAKAAAKPMSESIATSGSNPTLAIPVAGHNVAGGGGSGSGEGATPGERQDAGAAPQQELDALAMKIARSVLVRIKRERERRGIHV